MPREAAPDPTGSLPADVYGRLATLVRSLDDDASRQEIRSLCKTHGAEAAWNALLLGYRTGNAAQVVTVLGDLLPAEAGLVKRFDAAGLPDPRDLEFVQVIRRGYGTRLGWLVDYGPNGAEILAENLARVQCGPEAVKRPPSPDAFRSYCRAFFSTKLVDPEAKAAWFAWQDATNTNAFQCCVLADWSFRRGDIGNAMRLWAHARAIVAHPFSRQGEQGETFEAFIAEELATVLEQHAVLAAAEGAPRADLRDRWRTVVRLRGEKSAVQHDPASIPPTDLGAPNPFTAFGWHDAHTMVRLYDRLLAEDEAWREPEDLKALDTAALARYWMHKLRDSRAGRHATGSHSPSEVSWGPADDPARKLFALGAAAIPVLIEHYEDPAPIRGYRSYYSRGTGEDSYTPWRHADACIELLHLISGRVFRDRAAAEAWWDLARWTDPAAYYRKLLRSKDRESREKAALWLITLGDDEHLDAVIARILDGDEARVPMLAFLRGHVCGPAVSRLMPLVEDADLATAVAAAWALADTNHGRDALDMLLGRILKEPSEAAQQAMWGLAAMQDDDLRRSFARSLRHAQGKRREILLESAHRFPSREVLGLLVNLLEEDGRAVIAVKRMLIYEQVGESTAGEWRAAEVFRWLARNPNHDWAALQRRIQADQLTVWRFYPSWFW